LAKIALCLVLVFSSRLAAQSQKGPNDIIVDKPGPLVLEPVALPGGWAIGRWRLSNGDVVQLNSGCMEWGSYTGGFLLRHRSGWDSARVVSIDSGKVAENYGHLLVQGIVQLGSDGTGEEFITPKGIRAVFCQSNGAYIAYRLSAVDLKSGKVIQTFEDSYAPATAGRGRFVVFSKLNSTHGLGRQGEEKVQSYHLWDLKTGKTRYLGEARGKTQLRMGRSEVYIPILKQRTTRYLAVNGSTGRVRNVAKKDWNGAQAKDGIKWLSGASLSVPAPSEWTTRDGRPVLVQGRSDRAPRLPRSCNCGVKGPYFFHDLLLTDAGAFRWPAEIMLAKDTAAQGSMPTLEDLIEKETQASSSRSGM